MNVVLPNSRVDQIIRLVSDPPQDGGQVASIQSALRDVGTWPISDLDQLIRASSELDLSASGTDHALQSVLQSIASRWIEPSQKVGSGPSEIPALIAGLGKLYAAAPPSSAVRNYALRLLSLGGSSDSLRAFARWCIDDPPRHESSLGLAFAPLFRLPQPNFAALFPELLDGVQHRSLAAAILDLANHAFTSGTETRHPAEPRRIAIDALLGALVDRLSALENSVTDAPPAQRQQVIGESVAIAVSACRTLGLLGEQSARPNLRRACALKHRRIRAEAAGALALLGDPDGVSALIGLAEWPVSRLRALAYADELDLLDQIDPRYRSESARAEGELAAWLAEPTQFGIAPSSMELVDQRELYWPGYREPRTCFLFRFAYATPDGSWSNVGIAGPVAHATSAPLEDRSHDEIYALFAGWHAAHDDIYEMDWRSWTAHQKESLARRQAEWEEREYQDLQPVLRGSFFGDEFAVATGRAKNVWGYLIWGARESFWLPDNQHKLSADLAYCIFKGQKLLAQFNPEFELHG